ncbi:YceI family protein [Falsiruegeria mediterranea]|nr:YceI family protein [Falsiruegeria mediterranea]
MTSIHMMRSTPLTRRAVLRTLASLPVLGLPCANAALAKPTRYMLDPRASSVGFVFTLSGTAQRGTMPVKRADILIDPQNLTASTVDVLVDVSRAKTGLFFATQAMTGADVLNAARYPDIRFVSTRVQLGASGRISEGARITGDLTVRGVTRPITLEATLYRRPGSRADDLSQLNIRLRGDISRSAFGASGYSDLVTDTVTLDIQATINQTG